MRRRRVGRICYQNPDLKLGSSAESEVDSKQDPKVYEIVAALVLVLAKRHQVVVRVSALLLVAGVMLLLLLPKVAPLLQAVLVLLTVVLHLALVLSLRGPQFASAG